MEAAQAERAEVDIPFAVIDFDESDMLLAQVEAGGVSSATTELSREDYAGVSLRDPA